LAADRPLRRGRVHIACAWCRAARDDRRRGGVSLRLRAGPTRDAGPWRRVGRQPAGATLELLLLPGFLLGWILQLRALHRRFHFDAVHAHWFIPGAIVAACAIPGVPLCVTAHGTDVLRLRGGAWTWLRRRVAARARV